MRPLLTALACLVVPLAVVSCGRKQAAPPEIAITEDPPADDVSHFVFEGRLALGEPDAPLVCFRLRDGGFLEMKAGEEWKGATLDDASEFLATARDRHKLEMREAGQPELDEPYGYGILGSRLFVSIEAEPAAPWQHVQWLLTLVAEQHYYKLSFSDGTRKMLAYVPLDAAIEWIPDQLPPFVVVQVDVIPRAGVHTRWNETEVLRPTRFAYRASAVRYGGYGPRGSVVAGLDTGDLRDAGPWIAKVRQATEAIPRARLRGGIRVGHTVPFATVFDAMETLVSAGFPEVDLLMNTSIPSTAARSASRLPYPAKNYDPPLNPPK